ncbi:Transposase [Streptomyces sp. DvalAA-14]|nr:Transposase [Streptomyces sp. DvalAA-14]
MAAIWAGVDAGKTHHHCVAIDEGGRRLLSRRVATDEPELPELLAGVLALGDEVTWGIDLADGGAALVSAILFNHDQAVHDIPGRAIRRASESYRGEGKTDAKDAAVIADQVRIRRDLHPIRTSDETVTDLKILTGRGTDLVADRTRTVNRLRAQLSGIFPGLERALDLTDTGPLILLTGYQTPAALRRLGNKRLRTWLRNRSVRNADQLAQTAVQAAERQLTSLLGEKLTARMVHTLAKEVMALNQQVAQLAKLIEARFRDHHHFEAITSMPGLGIILGAEFLAATRPSSAPLTGSPASEESRRYSDRERAEGKRHTQAVLALARRRVNVLWALLRDERRVTRPRVRSSRSWWEQADCSMSTAAASSVAGKGPSRGRARISSREGVARAWRAATTLGAFAAVSEARDGFVPMLRGATSSCDRLDRVSDLGHQLLVGPARQMDAIVVVRRQRECSGYRPYIQCDAAGCRDQRGQNPLVAPDPRVDLVGCAGGESAEQVTR